jgi:two-component system chemotaxis response regulator CheB
VGHDWSAQTLLDAQHQAVGGAIYDAAAKLLEIAAVHRRLAELDPPQPGGREEHLRAAQRAEERAQRVQLAAEDPQPCGRLRTGCDGARRRPRHDRAI